ncbi:MAG: hypothetical protein INR70_05055 [Parafilimonas terrae]|nr:hypothetical protein [Parafilimonas terrae]
MSGFNGPTFPLTFDAAVQEGGYESRDGCWAGYVNRDVLAVWRVREWQTRDEIVLNYAIHMGNTFPNFRGGFEDARTWRDAGNLVFYGLMLGLIEEQVGPNGRRGWHLLDKEPHFIIVGTGAQRSVRQVRGLPPDQQRQQDKREATARKRAATLDRKAREKADATIGHQVRSILRSDPASTIPELWIRRGWIPEWLQGTRLDAAATVVREAHHAAEMDRPALKVWIRVLEREAIVAIGRPEKRRRQLAALPERAVIPDADADALGGLA